jgi:hypothetical protein
VLVVDAALDWSAPAAIRLGAAAAAPIDERNERDAMNDMLECVLNIMLRLFAYLLVSSEDRR